MCCSCGRVAERDSATSNTRRAAGRSRGVRIPPVSALELDSSITVLNRETIESATLQHFEELISLIPNMNLSGDGARARYFQMRGIGELEQYEGAPNPSVGFIVDDIDLSGVGGISTCSICSGWKC